MEGFQVATDRFGEDPNLARPVLFLAAEAGLGLAFRGDWLKIRGDFRIGNGMEKGS